MSHDKRKKSHGKRKYLTAKENISQRIKMNMCHAKRKCLTPNKKFSQQNKEKVKNNSD